MQKRRTNRANRRLACEVLEARLLLAANGADRRHLRLAVTATEEYTAFFGGRVEAQAAIEKTIAGVNKVFGRELNLQLDLIDNLDIIFGPGNSPDPFPSGGPGFVPNQSLVDSEIGSANYDIGILLGGISLGVAFMGGAGIDGSKAKAFSGFTPEEGGPAGANAISNALHEMAHQLVAAHPINGSLGPCSTGRSDTSAYEPGSGTTIVAYAGICEGDSVQQFNDDYYHSGNLDQMVAHLEMLDGLGVGTKDVGVNVVPAVDAGSDFTIPARTPFAVTVTGSDADDPSGKSLRYTIEQRDLGPAQSLDPFPGDNGESPLFRSFPPAPGQDDSYTRVFPQLSDILNASTTKGEYLPTTTRELNFRGTVRDGVGGTNGEDVKISVIDTGTPFQVTTLNSPIVLDGGATQNVTWEVAGTDANGINTAHVNIYLSTDGGLTFPYLLANTPNDGSHSVAIPNLNTESARIKVQGDGQIFFDISNADATIVADTDAIGITFTDGLSVGEGGIFAPDSDTYTLSLNTVPQGNVEITVSADEQTLVSADGTTFASSVSFTRTDTSPQTITVRPIDDSSSEGAHRTILSHAITASDDPDYSTDLIIDQQGVEIADDEQPPLLGIDFQPFGLSVPRNWRQANIPPSTSVPTTYPNLTREDGLRTEVDLVLTPTPFSSVGESADQIGSLTAPIHTPDLNALGGGIYFDQFHAPDLPSVEVEATWRSLTPGKRYNVYVFATEHFGTSFTGDPWIVNQRVTITGSGADDPPPIIQNSTAKQRQLLINDQEGDDTRTLESFAKTVTANSAGQIHIEIVRDDDEDANRVIISALAIQEVEVLPELFDFGDAPDDPGTPRYPTLTAHNGPVHTIGSLFLGASVDAETDGQPDSDALGDDNASSDDEDGVLAFITPVAHADSATTASVLVIASQAGKLDAWIDFDHNDEFAHPSEHLALGSSIDLVAGNNLVTFTVPAGSTPGDTFARFRISSSGNLSPTGAATDGEVEDYRITLLDGTSGTSSVVFDAPSAGEFEIFADGSEIVAQIGNEEVFRAPGDSVASVEFFGSAGDDVVSIGDLTGSFVAQGRINARAGNDTLRLTGGNQTFDC